MKHLTRKLQVTYPSEWHQMCLPKHTTTLSDACTAWENSAVSKNNFWKLQQIMLAMASKEHNSDPFPKYFNKEDQTLLRTMSIAGPKVAFSWLFHPWFASVVPLSVATTCLWNRHWMRNEFFCSNSLWTNPTASFWAKYLRFRYPNWEDTIPNDYANCRSQEICIFWMFASWFASFIPLTVDTIYLWNHNWVRKEIFCSNSL